MARWISDVELQEKTSGKDSLGEKILGYIRHCPSGNTNEILMKDESWPVFFHLASIRENIVNWYDFPPEADILEIGAGMGAVTGALCRCAHEVTAVELSSLRARVLFERHREAENLIVRAGDFRKMDFSGRFDLITLIGSLEHPGAFAEDGNPGTLLRRVRQLLKPGGKILLAVQNRYGLKNWCGAKDDHLSQPFAAMRGYAGNREYAAFSRQDLIRLLDENGLTEHRFFYPLPDYRCPQVIYSDQMLPQESSLGKIREYYPGNPTLILPERETMEQVIANGAFPFMANSFLVECGCGDARMSTLSYVSFTPERQKNKQVLTRIRGKECVEKLAAFPEGQEHLESILRTQSLLPASLVIPYERKGAFLQMPYLKGQTLDRLLVCAFEEGRIEEAKSLILRFKNSLEGALGESAKQGGSGETGLIDLIFQNCFVQNDEFVFFDQEWLCPGAPVEFTLYRAVHTLYLTNPWLEKICPRRQMMELAGIGSEQEHSFFLQELEFSRNIISQDFHCLNYLGRQTGWYIDEGPMPPQIMKQIRQRVSERVKRFLRPAVYRAAPLLRRCFCRKSGKQRAK